MKITLAPSWELSDEHAASRGGQPVLVDRDTGDAYGPGAGVQIYPTMGWMPAALGVRRLAQAADLDEEGRGLVARFVGRVALRPA